MSNVSGAGNLRHDPEHLFNLLIKTGFTLTHVGEWRPSNQQIAERPELADELERPNFLLIAARRD